MADELSLRVWLDRPGRSLDRIECLHIFRQAVDSVALAHTQGVVVENARPSCFLISSFNRVSFIESASCSSNSDGSVSGESNAGDRAAVAIGDGKKVFPLKQILVLEDEWYTSPEESAGGPATFASDIYRLGVLLFEIFCTFESLDEKLRSMSNLRHRVLPPSLLIKWPKEASFCLWLLHPNPDTRPKMSEVLQNEFLNGPKNILEEREAAVKLKEKIEEQEVLVEFLLLLQREKEETADQLHDTICFLSADIGEVLNKQTNLKNKISFPGWEKEDYSVVEKMNQPPLCPMIDEDSSCSGSRKRFRPGLQKNEESQNEAISEVPLSEICPEFQESVNSKSSRLMKNFTKVESAYLSTRYGLAKSADKPMDRYHKVTPATSTGRGSGERTEGSTVECLTSKKDRNINRKNEWINPFLEGLGKYLAFDELKVRADLKQGDLLSSSNLVCSLDFDRDKRLFATAGVSRKIKIFDCEMVLNEDRDIHYPAIEMASRSRVSCICWNSYIKSQLASSDFDGVVQVWDVARSQVFVQMKEHEQRVWSVNFSPTDPMKFASGSDDGAVKLWNINQAGSVGTIRTKANVCSVQFPPDSSQTIAIGSADHNVYCYDLRNVRVPLCTMVGHAKTVSYIKYLDASTIVSASTDSTLKLWDISSGSLRVIDSPIQTFTGHTNTKNFVGLSIYDGYIATGSETNEVFIYHKSFPMPVLPYKFGAADPITGREVEDSAHFISSVSWRGESSTLLAANSSGNIKLLEMV